MEKRHKKEIEEIIGDLKCPKDFKCYRSGFEKLCRARDTGIESYLECLEQNPSDCTFAVAFGSSFYCKCPIRVYLSKNLNK